MEKYQEAGFLTLIIYRNRNTGKDIWFQKNRHMLKRKTVKQNKRQRARCICAFDPQTDPNLA